MVPLRGFRAVRMILGALLAFVGALTFGNGPTVFFGYGLSSFALFVIGLVYRPKEALVAFVVGTFLGVLFDLKAQSLFAFVGVGALVVRSLQLVLLLYLRPKYGNLSASLVVLLFGVFIAVGVGLATFGEEASMTAFSAFDIVYLPPAMLLRKIVSSNASPITRAGGTAMVVGGTMTAFASASVFLLPGAFVGAIAVLALAFVLFGRSVLASGSRLRSSIEIGGPAISVVVLVALVLISYPTSGFALRALGYPLTPDGLSGQQWMQVSSAPGCRAGNLAGAGTIANGVWGPARLRVLSTCVSVTGVIEGLASTAGPSLDDDYSFDLRLDPGYEWTLSLGSYVLNDGKLHVEIVPLDQPSVFANVTLSPGDHVRVIGVLVLDTDHGWTSEIHPAWAVMELPRIL